MASEANWDVRLLRVWGTLLILGWLLPMPVSMGRPAVWLWPWEILDDASTGAVLQSLLQLALGIGAIWVAASASHATRGAFALSAALACVLVPLASEMGSALLNTPLLGTVGVLGMLGFLGLPAIAAGNRVYRRQPTHAGAPFLAALGGAGVLLAAVFPILHAGRESHALIEILGIAEAWRTAWPLLIWWLCLLVASLLAMTLFFRPDPRGVPLTLGWGLRALMWSLPVALLIVCLQAAEATGLLLVAFLKTMLLLYGIVILLAVGAARLLQGAEDTGPSEAQLRKTFE